MPTRALSARALSGGLCVAGADQNRLLRRPVPPSVAQTRGSEGLQINVRPRRGKGKLMPMHALRSYTCVTALQRAGSAATWMALRAHLGYAGYRAAMRVC